MTKLQWVHILDMRMVCDCYPVKRIRIKKRENGLRGRK